MRIPGLMIDGVDYSRTLAIPFQPGSFMRINNIFMAEVIGVRVEGLPKP
jgi:hypothetical protein